MIRLRELSQVPRALLQERRAPRVLVTLIRRRELFQAPRARLQVHRAHPALVTVIRRRELFQVPRALSQVRPMLEHIRAEQALPEEREALVEEGGRGRKLRPPELLSILRFSWSWA